MRLTTSAISSALLAAVLAVSAQAQTAPKAKKEAAKDASCSKKEASCAKKDGAKDASCAKKEAAKHAGLKVVGVFNHVETPQDAAAEVLRAMGRAVPALHRVAHQIGRAHV